MTLFLGFLFFLIFGELFCINSNLIIFMYMLYTFFYYIAGNYVVSIFSYNRFDYKYNLFLFKHVFLSSLSFFKKLLGFFSNPRLVWKPLFKKSSYFGLYRSNKNQWLNK